MQISPQKPFAFATRIDFRARVTGDFSLPPYAGSMLRGAFGHSLRNIACMTGMPECKDCPLRFSCAYSYLFETPVSPQMAVLRKYSAAPHPLVIEPPTGARELKSGQSFIFSMVLLGNARLYLPLIVLAWQRALSTGLGKTRAVARLTGYRTESETQWRDPQNAVIPPINPIIIPPQSPGELEIRFVTPFRSRQNGKLNGADGLQFLDLISHLQRRMSLLLAFHCAEGPWEWDYTGALQFAEKIQWISENAHWLDWARYSSRQQQSMQLGGVVGSFRVPETSLEALWPLLYLGQWLHVGKNASFGLGRYTLKSFSNAATAVPEHSRLPVSRNCNDFLHGH